MMFDEPLRLSKPGLFVTGTDTHVGKTVATCAIAAAMRSVGLKVGVCKPFASGCRREREGLVSGDAEALAYFAGSRQPMEVVCPLRYAAPVAPGVADAELDERMRDAGQKGGGEKGAGERGGGEWGGGRPEFERMVSALERLDRESDVLLIEGVGGAMVPLDGRHTVLDFAKWLGLPSVIVARSVLGTLNHTAMTAAVMGMAGVQVRGVVMNGYDADVAKQEDPSVGTNRAWIEKMTGLPVIATLARSVVGETDPEGGKIAEDILAAAREVDWMSVIG